MGLYDYDGVTGSGLFRELDVSISHFSPPLISFYRVLSLAGINILWESPMWQLLIAILHNPKDIWSILTDSELTRSFFIG